MITIVKTDKVKRPRKFGNTPEGKVKTAIAAELAGLGSLSYHCPVPCGYGQSGVADFVGCFKGMYFEIEAKAAGGTQSALQRLHEDEIMQAGGAYLLIGPQNVGEVRGLLISHLESRGGEYDA